MNRGVLGCLLLGVCVALPAQDFPDFTFFSQLKTVIVSLCEQDETPGWNLLPGAAWKKPEASQAPDLEKLLPGKWESSQLALVKKQNRSFLSVKLPPGDAPGTAAKRLTLALARPVPLRGQVQEIAFMYRGDADLELKLVIEDVRGFVYKIPVTVAKTGNWVCYKAGIPPFIHQADFFNSRSSCSFRGFEFRTGTAAYMLELDLITATTDLFLQENRDPDSVEDNW